MSKLIEAPKLFQTYQDYRKEIHCFNKERETGIYFLELNGIVVNVGLTKNKFYKRVYQDPDKKPYIFTKAYSIRYKPEHLKEMETKFIRLFVPYENKQKMKITSYGLVHDMITFFSFPKLPKSYIRKYWEVEEYLSRRRGRIRFDHIGRKLAR